MRNWIGWAAIGLAVVVVYYVVSPAVNEALGGSWWWWLLVAALLAVTIWRDHQSSRKPPDNRPSEPRR